jgi:hypothetical protein
MSYYSFFTYDDASQVDEIGCMSLESDDIALAFGGEIVRDLIRDAPSEHLGWTLEIVDGNRAVATIPFKLDAIRD